ncbi:MAG TPA: DUF433 domain-containing protein [bacterium]|nr:DUF433 domain-containing protein [bacterium]
MNYRDVIMADPNVMLGKPVIKGTRLSVELILRKLAEGMSVSDLIAAYPNLTQDKILAVLSYSADVMSREELLAS